MNKLLATIKSTSESKDGVGSFEAVLSVPTVDRDNEVVDAKAFDPLPDHITIDIDHAMTVEKTIGSGTPFYDGDVLKFKGTYASHPLAQMVRGLVDEGHIRTMSVAYMNSVYEVDEKDHKNHLRKGELLNAGIVGIPSNREALITASKALVGEVMDTVQKQRPVGGAGGGSYVTTYTGSGGGGPNTTVSGLNTTVTIPFSGDPSKIIEELQAFEKRNGPDWRKAGARNSTQDLSLLQTAHDALAALGAACEAKASPAGDEQTTTDSHEKAAPAADTSPAEPARSSQVDVAIAKARASAAAAQLALTRHPPQPDPRRAEQCLT